MYRGALFVFSYRLVDYWSWFRRRVETEERLCRHVVESKSKRTRREENVRDTKHARSAVKAFYRARKADFRTSEAAAAWYASGTENFFSKNIIVQRKRLYSR